MNFVDPYIANHEYTRRPNRENIFQSRYHICFKSNTHLIPINNSRSFDSALYSRMLNSVKHFSRSYDRKYYKL